MCVLCTVLRHSGARHSERRLLAASFGSERFVANVNHPVQGVLCTVVRHSRAGYSKRRSLAAGFGSVLSVAPPTIPSEACCAQYSAILVPASPNVGHLPQPSVLHLCCTRQSCRSSRAVLSNSPFWCRSRRTTTACCSIRSCTSYCGRRLFSRGWSGKSIPVMNR